MDKTARLLIILLAGCGLGIYAVLALVDFYHGDKNRSHIGKECTELPPTFFESEGWRRVHEADYYYILKLRSEGKAETMTHPMKCREFTEGSDIEVTWAEQMWWRKI